MLFFVLLGEFKHLIPRVLQVFENSGWKFQVIIFAIDRFIKTLIARVFARACVRVQYNHIPHPTHNT